MFRNYDGKIDLFIDELPSQEEREEIYFMLPSTESMLKV